MSNLTVNVDHRQIDTVAHLVQGLTDMERDRAVRAGLLAGGRLLTAGGRRRLRSRMASPQGVTGCLLRAFTVRVKRSKPGVLAGFRTGKGGGGHAHLVDQGTLPRQTREGLNRGHARPTSFWEDTARQDAGRALDRVTDAVEEFVLRKMKN